MDQAWELSEASQRLWKEAQNVLKAGNKGPRITSCLLPGSPAALNPSHFLEGLSFSPPGFTQALRLCLEHFPLLSPSLHPFLINNIIEV